MGLFAKKTQTKTEVKPNKNVENILKKVTDLTMNTPDGEFIKRQAAQLSKSDLQAIQDLSDSVGVKQAANTLAARLNTGQQQQAAANAGLQTEVRNPVTLKGILSDKNTLMGGLNKNALNQGLALNPALQGSAAARKASKLYGTAARANNALTTGANATNLALNNQLSNAQDRLRLLNQMGNVGQANTAMGITGANLGQQATQNKLNAGNILQGVQQAQYNTDWQNANAEALDPWAKLNDKLNVMNQVSGMAGYTSTGSQAAPSKTQQLLGAGLTGLGMAGNLGAFDSASPFAGLSTAQTNQAYNTGLASSGGFAGVDTPANYASNMASVRGAAQAQGGGSGFMNTNLGQSLQSGWNGLKSYF